MFWRLKGPVWITSRVKEPLAIWLSGPLRQANLPEILNHWWIFVSNFNHSYHSSLIFTPVTASCGRRVRQALSYQNWDVSAQRGVARACWEHLGCSAQWWDHKKTCLWSSKKGFPSSFTDCSFSLFPRWVWLSGASLSEISELQPLRQTFPSPVIIDNWLWSRCGNDCLTFPLPVAILRRSHVLPLLTSPEKAYFVLKWKNPTQQHKSFFAVEGQQ